MDIKENPVIARAMHSVMAAAAHADSDPTRPVYHFRPPAFWMNDPNGTIYHNGYYHLFYQHNPYGEAWGHIHWGHARSTDLVHWEHLPIALWPAEELGEGHCFSGCAAVNGRGQPMLFYTRVTPGDREERQANEQWAALGDADWRTWQKHPDNPILSLATHGGPQFEGDWRDPFIFTEAGRTFMVLGAALDEQACVALYEAEDNELVQWRYCGLLYARPRTERRFLECPNFFKLDDRWILITSPYQRLEYVIGRFDLASLTFEPEQQGILDHGFGDVPHFYASNILFDAQDRCILLGWVRGFPAGRGWNGCLSLPRVLTIGSDGRPRQTPIPELHALRGDHSALSDVTLHDGGTVLENVRGGRLEMQITLALGSARAVGVRIRCADDRQRGVAIHFDGDHLHVGDNTVPVQTVTAGQVALHLFLDRSVLELFVDDGHTCVTQVLQAPAADVGVELAAEGDGARLISLDVWTLQSIW